MKKESPSQYLALARRLGLAGFQDTEFTALPCPDNYKQNLQTPISLKKEKTHMILNVIIMFTTSSSSPVDLCQT